MKSRNWVLKGTFEESARKQYPGVRGKVVDWVEHRFEDGTLYIHVRFKDRTELTYTPRLPPCH